MTDETATTTETAATTSPDSATTESVEQSLLDSTSSTETAPTDFHSQIPEDLRNDPALANIKDVGTMAKSLVSAQRMIGGRIPIPTKEASDEVKNEFYQKLTSIPGVVRLPAEGEKDAEKILGQVYDKLGRPQSPDKYTIETPEGLELDEQFMKSVKETAYKVGLNNQQLNALAKLEVERSLQISQMLDKSRENVTAFFKKEWGNDYAARSSAVEGLLNKYATKFPDAVAEIRAGYAGRNPVIISMAAELGRLYQQQGTIAVKDGVSGGRTPEQAKQELADILSNKSHAYYNPKDPVHQNAVEKVRALYKDVYPEVKN